MNVVGIVMICILGAFVTWLTIDTIIYIVKRAKQRKKAKSIHFKDTEEKEVI